MNRKLMILNLYLVYVIIIFNTFLAGMAFVYELYSEAVFTALLTFLAYQMTKLIRKKLKI